MISYDLQVKSRLLYVSMKISLFSHSVVSERTATQQASLSLTNSWSLLRLMNIELVLPCNHLILCRPLLLPPSIFSNESVLCIQDQSIGVSASASILSMNIQDWFPLGWTGWISLLSKGLSRVFSNTTVEKHQFFSSAFFTVQLSHPYVTTGKAIALTRWTFVGKVMSLFFNILSRLVVTFLPRSKPLLISWLQSPSVVILEPPKIESATVSTDSPYICHEVMGPDAMILVFWMLSFKPTFSLSSFLSSWGSLVLLHFLP